MPPTRSSFLTKYVIAQGLIMYTREDRRVNRRSEQGLLRHSRVRYPAILRRASPEASLQALQT